ncbi:MAG TPA: hypothetical protein VGR37_01555 [Longimicrobiaceae bacterium]|nr:hypothetical protein [Longimicrobiaceae bacterium]
MSQQTDSSDVPTIERLVEAELGERGIRDGGRNWLVHPPKDLFGLALSGGGIRSATFNLGLLQGLSRLKLLESFDYVSTVSGGGYLGGFWTRWRDVTGNAKEFPSGDVPPDCPEPQEVRNLREFSNFLTPRIGVFSFDTGRMLVTAVSSMIPSLATVLGMLAAGMLVWALLTWALISPAGFADVPRGTLPAAGATLLILAPLVLLASLRAGPAVTGWAYAVAALLLFAEAALDAASSGPVRLSTLLLVSITAVTLLGFEMAWRRRREDGPIWQFALATLVCLVVVGAAWEAFVARWDGPGLSPYHPELKLPWVSLREEKVWKLAYLLTPVVAWGAGILSFVLLRTVGSRWMTSVSSRSIRAAFDRVHARLLFLVAAWVVLTVIWSAGVFMHSWIADGSEVLKTSGVGAVVAALTGISSWIQKKLGLEPSRPSGGGFIARLKPLLPQILSYTAIALMLAGVAALCVELAGPGGPFRDGWGPAVLVALAAGLAGVGLVVFDPNEVGIHGFYRARLARAYCGASNADARRKTEEHVGDDVRLNELKDAAKKPFHLICCAANDLGSDGIANLYRGARSAVLSPVGFSVGDEWAPWGGCRRVPTLSAAMTAAGAAFNSLMGWRSVEYGPGVTFLMAAFNLRLGLWAEHPRRLRLAEAALRRASREPTHESPARAAWRWIRRNTAHRRLFIGLPYYKELFSLAPADGSDVHLSDGGHFENLAIYELIRRHCRVIVASDCGQDGDAAFDDMGNLVRKVRQDFGVDVRIDLSPLKPGPDGRARQHMVAGDIHYPDGDTGVLLFFKPALVGSEPADVAQYRTRNPAFPHQPTGDQFYDQAQWESYRRLGEHAALTAFRRLTRGESEPDPVEVFARARREWLSAPEGAAERLVRFADEVTSLDEMLRGPGCDTLLREVYPEWKSLEPRLQAQIPVPVLYPAQPGATDDDPVATLHVIRKALGFLFEVYEREDLARNSSHPLYLGVMNYFARWATAPLVQFWWPVLRALYPQPFARFLQAEFGLGRKIGRIPLSKVQWGGDGLARNAWERIYRRGPEAVAPDVVSYQIRLRYEKRRFKVQAALVAATLVPEPGGGTSSVLLWDARNFFVPPGLWGIGIGQDFLSRLTAWRTEGVSRIVVCIKANPAAGSSEKKTTADQMQMYRSAGFKEANYDSATQDLVLGSWRWNVPDQSVPPQPDEYQWVVYDLGLAAADPSLPAEGTTANIPVPV